jgi:hypothetical protein
MIHRVGFRFTEVDLCHAFEEDRQLQLSEVYASQESGDVTETILCIIVSRLIAVVTLITFITVLTLVTDPTYKLFGNLYII